MLREAGFEVVAMADAYPDGADQEIADDDWIERASGEGWVALTKDVAIVRDHRPALENSTLRVFALNNANLAGEQMVERYRANLNRIVQRASQPGPYVYVVTASSLDLRWRPGVDSARAA